MKKVLTILCFVIFGHQPECLAQFNQQIDSLCIVCNRSTTDSEKVVALGKLADYYYTFKLNSKGDSILHEQLLIAEVSNNSSLVLKALFGDAIINVSQFTNEENFNKTMQFLQKGIEYARATNKQDYLALGYLRMAYILRKKGAFDQALTNCISAISLLQNVTSDSIKAVIYIELGDTYMARGDAVTACTNYNSAYDIAIRVKSVSLQSRIHHSLSEMYKKLENTELARNELSKSLALNNKAGNQKGIMMDYFDLARLTDEKYFIQRSLELADSLNDFKQLLHSKRLMLVYYYVVEKNSSKAFNYLKDEPDLRQSFLNEGMEKYLITEGNIYFYTGQIDSALVYYKKAETALHPGSDMNLLRTNFEQIGECQRMKQNYPAAISAYQNALNISLKMDDPNMIAFYSGKLSELYEKKSDYKNALLFSRQFLQYKDKLRELSRQNDIALMGVDRENKKHQQELLQQRQKEFNNRNIQYVGITISIIILFFVMLFVGSYPVSPLTVKLMGYFFFISLFEFISLMIDNLFIFPVAHNQPLKSWLIKIGIIVVLVPFQQFLEHRVTRLLASRKLIEARTKFSFRKWWSDLNKRALGKGNLNSDQAVM